MSGTRFARSGRCRFFVCLGAIVLMFGMLAIFHNQSQQLDETREQSLRCEQQHEAVNEQLRSIVEQKFNLEKSHEHLQNEQMETRRNLELKLKEQSERTAKEQMDARVRYDKLQQSHKLLQSEHNELVTECTKNKKLQLDEANTVEKALKSVRSELAKSKSVQSSEIALWREKYNTIVQEKERLEILLNAAETQTQQLSHVVDLERTIADYQSHCDYKPKEQQQINKPLNPPDTTRNASPQPHGFDKPRNDKSFSELEVVNSGLYHIAVKTVNKTQNVATNNLKVFTTAAQPIGSSDTAGGRVVFGDGAAASLNLEKIQQLLPYSARNNRSLIINSVENFQIVPKPMKKLSEETETQLKQQPDDNAAALPVLAGDKIVSPLSAPRKSSSTQASKSPQSVLEANAHLKQAANSSVATNSSSTSLPPLAQPPNQRKLPENVAPIPVEDNDNQAIRDRKSHDRLDNAGADGVDINAAVEEMPKNENDDGNNNRYANVVNDIETKGAHKLVANEDSGAHEIKDHDFMNDPSFNLPAEEDNNFFDGGDKKGIADAEKPLKGDGNQKDDDDIVGADADIEDKDIAVKNHNHLREENNLNNEIAGDQGKEFPEGLRMEDGNDEDEDEDDYSNPAARQQGAQAIRN